MSICDYSGHIVLWDIKYYKIKTGNSVLIRGKNLKKKKKILGVHFPDCYL